MLSKRAKNAERRAQRGFGRGGVREKMIRQTGGSEGAKKGGCGMRGGGMFNNLEG